MTNIGDVLGITVDIEVLGPQAKANIMHMAMGWQLKANVQSAQPPVRAQLKVCMCANPQLCSVGEDDEDYAQGTMLVAVALELVLAARARAMSFIMVAGRPIAERTFVVVVRGVRTPRRPTDWRKIGRDLSPGVVVLQQNTTRVFEHQKLVSAPG